MPSKPSLTLIRLFLSSPGDVSAERGRVRAVVDELNHDPMYKDRLQIEIIAWDDPHADVVMPVTLTPQQAIDLGLPRPSQCDICITLFWGRMGTPLDVEAHGTKPDGTPYWSGTEWEYLDAVKGARENGTGLPVVYVYRRAVAPLAAQAVAAARSYFAANRTRLRYAHFRARGFQIGSGSMESGCKQIALERLKIAGAQWSPEGACKLAKARAAFLSHQVNLSFVPLPQVA